MEQVREKEENKNRGKQREERGERKGRRKKKEERTKGTRVPFAQGFGPFIFIFNKEALCSLSSLFY